MIEKLLDQEIPPEFIPWKPTLPVVAKETRLDWTWELYCFGNYWSIEKKDVHVESWKTNMTSNHSCKKFCNFVQNIECVNDCSERNIKLVQEFVMSSTNEDQRQKVMLAARDNRKKMKLNRDFD